MVEILEQTVELFRKRTGDLNAMNLLDFCELLGEDYLVVAVDHDNIVFDGRASSIGDADKIGIEDARTFVIFQIELNSIDYDADIVVFGQQY